MERGPPDRELVARSVDGDHEAFGVLAERYYRMVWFLAYQRTGHRSDAEDVVQESFVRAFNALPQLREPAKFASWLYNIALKLSIDLLRRRERRDGTVSLDEEAVGRAESGRLGRSAVKGVGADLEAAEEHARVLDGVGRLPDKYRLVLTLRHVHRMSYRQIAEHLAEPAGTVANRLHRATRMLQEQLAAEESAQAELPGERRP